MGDRERLFRGLSEEVEGCGRCGLCARARNRVVGEGNLDSRVVFVGEAPGRREDESGRPFVGSAGKLLDGLLAGAGLSRREVFISNVVMCRPPENRKPTRAEVEVCSGHLESLLEIIGPKVVAPMGNSAVEYFFAKYGIDGAVIGNVHGKSRRVTMPWGEVVIFPLYHPAATIYNRGLRGELEVDMVTLARLL